MTDINAMLGDEADKLLSHVSKSVPKNGYMYPGQTLLI